MLEHSGVNGFVDRIFRMQFLTRGRSDLATDAAP